MHAFGGGKTIESKSKRSTNWQEDYFPSWNWEEYDYRVKAEEKWKEWSWEYDIPVGAQLKSKSDLGRWRASILGYDTDGIVSITFDLPPMLSKDTFINAFTHWLCSTDGGKTWQPCGVKVS